MAKQRTMMIRSMWKATPEAGTTEAQRTECCWIRKKLCLLTTESMGREMLSFPPLLLQELGMLMKRAAALFMSLCFPISFSACGEDFSKGLTITPTKDLVSSSYCFWGVAKGKWVCYSCVLSEYQEEPYRNDSPADRRTMYGIYSYTVLRIGGGGCKYFDILTANLEKCYSQLLKVVIYIILKKTVGISGSDRKKSMSLYGSCN